MDEPAYFAVVVTPTHNAVDTIADTILSVERSVLAWAERSGRSPREIAHVIADDGSSDDTLSRVSDLASHLTIDVHIHPDRTKRGRAAARNRAARLYPAELLFFLDHDDFFLPHHVHRCVDALTRESRIDFVKTGVILDGDIHPFWEDAVFGSLTQNLCVRAHVFRLTGGFLEDPEVETYGCDDVLFNRILRESFRGHTIHDATVRFVKRPGNSLDRQWDKKLTRPPNRGENTLNSEQLAATEGVGLALDRRRREVRERLARTRRLLGRATPAPPPDTRLQDAFHRHFYAQGAWLTTTWFGHRVLKSPFDLWVYQEILFELQPDLVIETGTHAGGFALFAASCMELMGKGRVVSIDKLILEGRPSHPRIEYLTGPSLSEGILQEVSARARDSASTMVSLDARHARDFVAKELEAYSPFVTPGSYLVVEDTNVDGHPVRPGYREGGDEGGPWDAVTSFLERHAEFSADRSREKYGVTFNPRGWLKRG